MNKKFKLVSIVGNRPNFIKMYPLIRSINRYNQKSKDILEHIIIHTGQHYDENLSDIFFKELALPSPNYNLNIGSGTQGSQTAKIILQAEKILTELKPDIVIVYGDTNSTLGGAITASKLYLPIAHVEAGLRSYNRKMPEEINRIIVDHLSDLLFAPTDSAINNLVNEGLAEKAIQVGDIMYDALLTIKQRAEVESDILNRLNLKPKKYAVATVHRAENTDDIFYLKNLLSIFDNIAKNHLPLILSVHPRTHKVIKDHFSDWKPNKYLTMLSPIGYIDMIKLINFSSLVLTDSGGLQKEAFMLNIPCITLRNETEWLETVDCGGNIVAGMNSEKILKAVTSRINLLSLKKVDWSDKIPKLFGNGNASEIMLEKILAFLSRIDKKY